MPGGFESGGFDFGGSAKSNVDRYFGYMAARRRGR